MKFLQFLYNKIKKFHIFSRSCEHVRIELEMGTTTVDSFITKNKKILMLSRDIKLKPYFIVF